MIRGAMVSSRKYVMRVMVVEETTGVDPQEPTDPRAPNLQRGDQGG